MGEYDLHSLILACDFHVDDVDRMWKWLKKHRDPLASIGAHHVVLYTSIWEHGRVLVTIGIRQAHSIRDVLRSPRYSNGSTSPAPTTFRRFSAVRWSRRSISTS